jgi:hypothetical protein
MPSPHDLDILATVHRAAFPSRGIYMAARRGLRRLAKGDAADVADPVAALRERIEAGAVDRRSGRDEMSALRHLARLPTLDLDVARRIRRGDATLADALVCVEAQAQWGAERGRVIGAMKRLAEALGLTPEGMPASLPRIDALFDRHTAAEFGLQPTAYANLKSRVRRAVRLVDIESARHLKAGALTGPWRLLMDAAEDHGTAAAKGAHTALWRLVRYCHDRDLMPDAVDDAVVTAFLAHLEERRVKNAFEVARKAVYAWETLQSLVPEWPSQTLSRLYAADHRTRPWPAFQDLPPHIQAIWTDYETATLRQESDTLADLVVDNDDEFADIDGSAGVGGGLSASSLRARKSVWLQAVAVAREAGVDVALMADVTSVDVCKGLLTRIGERQKKAAEAEGRTYTPKNLTRKNVAMNLRMMAHYAGADEATLETLVRLQDKVDPHLVRVTRDPRSGKERRVLARKRMGPRHVRVMEQFRNPMTLLSWFRMPDTLIAAARTMLARPGREQEGRVLVISALCHLILRDVPLRRGDLGPQTIFGDDRTLIMPPGRRGRARIVLTTRKTGASVDRELSERTTEVLRWWITDLRPEFIRHIGADPASPYLFPSAGTVKPYRDEGVLNRHFQAHNQKYGGFSLNIHAERHLVGKIILDQDPTQIDLVRQMLTHERVETTERYYAEINEILVQRKIHDILAEAERLASRRSRR